jgi:transposase-like protein
MRFPGYIIAEAVHAYQVKQSLRDVQRFILNTFKIKISWRTVKNWVEKFGEKIKQFVSTFKYQLSGMWHADEIFITWGVRNPDNHHEIINNEKYFCWFVMDAQSRWLAYPEYSTERTVPPAIRILKKTLSSSKTIPQFICTDSFQAYNIAIKKVL